MISINEEDIRNGEYQSSSYPYHQPNQTPTPPCRATTTVITQRRLFRNRNDAPIIQAHNNYDTITTSSESTMSSPSSGSSGSSSSSSTTDIDDSGGMLVSSSASTTTSTTSEVATTTTTSIHHKDTDMTLQHPELASYGFRNYIEIVLYITIIIIMITTLIFGIFITVTIHQQHHVETYLPIPVQEEPPSIPLLQQPTISDQEKLDIIIKALSESQALADKASLIPLTVHELQLKVSRAKQWRNSTDSSTVTTFNNDDSYVLAAAYIINDDTTNIIDHVISRYVLATFYYNTNGDLWHNNTHWLSNESHCNWYGITCCTANTMERSTLCTTPNDYGRIIQIDLYHNNLMGIISPIIGLLSSHLQSIYLSHNQLSGTIPGMAMGELSHLVKFYASYNQLSGTIPTDFQNSDIFSTLYVQGNNLSGTYPFCTSNRLYNFGIDCDKVQCENTNCCDMVRSCFFQYYQFGNR